MPQPVVNTVDIDSLKAGLADGTIALVDVRERNEWDAGHIAGAVLNPLSAFDPAVLPRRQPGRTVVLHCRSGKRSVAALGLAQEAGRSDIATHYEGGMLGWLAAGEPVAR